MTEQHIMSPPFPPEMAWPEPTPPSPPFDAFWYLRQPPAPPPPPASNVYACNCEGAP